MAGTGFRDCCDSPALSGAKHVVGCHNMPEEDRIILLRNALLPFAELAWAEPDNAEGTWSLPADHFRHAAAILAKIEPS